MFRQQIGRVVEKEEYFSAPVRHLRHGSQHTAGLATFRDRNQQIGGTEIQFFDLSAPEDGVIFKEFHTLDQGEVAAGHDAEHLLSVIFHPGSIPAGSPPHAFQKDGKSSRGAAAGEGDPAAGAEGLFHGSDKFRIFHRQEHAFCHGKDLPVHPLQGCHAFDGGAFEIIFQRPAEFVGLFRRQETEMECFFVMDKMLRLFCCVHSKILSKNVLGTILQRGSIFKFQSKKK